MKTSTKIVTFALVVILSVNLVNSEERWSRQLPLEEQPSSVASKAAGNDWVPLSEPCPTCKLGADRTENGKSLRFYEDNAPAAQQQYQFFEQPPFNNRFNHQQQNGALDVFPPQAQHVNNLQPAPAFQFLPKQPVQSKQIPVFVEQHQTETHQKNPFAEPLIQHQRPYQFMQDEIHKQQPHFMTNYQPQPVVQNQHHQFGPPPPQFHQAQNVPQYHRPPPQNQAPQFQGPPPANAPIFQQAPPAGPPQFVQQQTQNGPPQFSPQNPEEEVQLLYVPYETLYNQQGQPQQGLEGLGQPGRFSQQQSRYNILNQPVSASLINDFYSENTVPAGPRPTTTQRPATRRTQPITTTQRPYTTTPFSFYLTKPTNPPQFSQKPKAHQPPLSMFMLDKYDGKVSEKDVLRTLRTSNNIDVRDSVEKNAPKIFIGPSGMLAPKGYSKFELPYLSSIENNRHERRIEELPFFVAPLSYKTPPGFSKIPLPAPHVGSVVVNQPENEIDDQEEAHVITKEDILFNRPSEVSSHPNRPFIDPTKDRQRITLTTGVNYKPQNTFMQNFTVPSKESAYNTFNHNDDYQFSTLKPYSAITTAAPEYTRSVFTTEYPTRSTFTTQRPTYNPTTTRQPITRQPATRQPATRPPTTRTSFRQQPTFEPTFEPTYKPQFGDFEDQKTVNEEYFNYEKTHKKPVKGHYSFSFGDDVKKPDIDYNFKKTPELSFGSNNANYEENFTTKQPRIKEQTVRFSTTQAPQEQEFNSPTGRPQFSFQTTNAPYSSNFDYAPTISTIAQQSDNFSPQVSSTRDYSQGNFVNDFRSSAGPQDDYQNRFRLGDQEKTTAQTESPENVYRQEQEILDSLAPTVAPTDDSEYNLPSELPPINANLPGLVNSLMEEKWMVKNDFPGSDATTRKPVTRGRRPVSSTYRAAAPTTESSVDNTRKPVDRTRRPSVHSSRQTESSLVATQSSTPRTRTVTVNRNPNKVRYNPSPEDRKQFRSRTRAPLPKTVKVEDNIDFQRDVLNQNYPTASPHLLRPLTTTTEKPAVDETQYTQEVQADFTSPPKEEQYLQEVITSQEEYNRAPVIPENTEVIPLGGNTFTETDESFQKYNSPSQAPLYFDVQTTTSTTTQSPFKAKNHKYSQNFGGLLEPMQIPHQHPTLKQKPSTKTAGKYQYSSHNFDEDATTNSYNRVSSRAPASESQKSNLPRRRPSIYTTTQDAPSATTDNEQQQEAVTVKETTTRPKLTTRKEGGVVVKKIRGRVRKPLTATTESSEAENYDYVPKTSTRRVSTPTIRSRSSYNSNRSSQRGTTTPSSNAKDDTTESRPRFRIRENTPRFKLEQQESQWSPRLNQNSFQPLGDDEKINFNKKHLAIEDGQDIITANPLADTPETYLLNVSASMTPTKETPESTTVVPESEIDGKKTEKSEFEPNFAKLIKEVMTDIDTDEEKPAKEVKPEKKATGTDKKQQQQGRRGVWKRVRVRPADSFETAESQNIGNHFFNNLSFDEKKTATETKGFKPVDTSDEDETMQHSDVEVVPQKAVTEKPEPEVFTTEMPEIEIKEEIVTDAPIIQTTTFAPIPEKVEISDKLTKLMPINDDEMPMFPIEHMFKSKEENATVSDVDAVPTTTTHGLFKEAQKALTELFSFDDDDQEFESEDSSTKMAYHSINRETTEESATTTTALPPTELPATLQPVKKDEKTKPVVLTSQSTEVSHETEICYRGRCVKTEEKNKKK